MSSVGFSNGKVAMISFLYLMNFGILITAKNRANRNAGEIHKREIKYTSQELKIVET